MKETYESLELEVIEFDSEDVIVTSGDDPYTFDPDPNETEQSGKG